MSPQEWTRAWNYAVDRGIHPIAYFLLQRLPIEFVANIHGRSAFQGRDGGTILHDACREGWLDIVRILVRSGYQVNAKNKWGQTPLMQAAELARLSVVEHLLELEADVMCRAVDGETLLHIVCANGWTDIVKRVVKRGCDVNAINGNRRTPLMVAASSLKLDIVEYLYHFRGANVEGSDAFGWTVLHYMCFGGFLEMVQDLIFWSRRNINAQNEEGNTPLHVANPLEEPDREIIRCLLNAGADCTIRNEKGETAFSCFLRESQSLNLITLFIENGAYFKNEEYAILNNNMSLKVGILQNAHLCSIALMNKCMADFHDMYQNPVVSGRLPAMEKLEITIQNIAQDFEKSVDYEIRTHGFCDLLKVRPLNLRWFCILRLARG